MVKLQCERANFGAKSELEEIFESLSLPGQGANPAWLWTPFCSDSEDTRTL